jgi:hypothetical protein
VSLSAHDKEALDLIEEGLAGSDPRFAAKLSAFSQLTDGGEMPARERIRAAGRPAAFRGLLFRDSRPGRRTRPRRPLYWVTVAVWLSISVTMIAVALVLSHSSAATCARGQGTGCANRSAPSAPRVPAGQNVKNSQNVKNGQNVENGQYGTGFLGP